MDADLYKQSIEYEQLTKSIYEAVMARDGNDNIKVLHNVEIEGRSGVKHQIDVMWDFQVAGIKNRVLIECKNYASSITLEKVRNFFAVLHDIGNCNGVMVTKTGYQSGAAQFAKHYGISLKLLRQPNVDDWKGLIKNINATISFRGIVSNADCYPRVGVKIECKTNGEEDFVRSLLDAKKLSCGPDTVFYSADHEVATEELRWWLPKQIGVSDYPDGGPHQKHIELDEKYLFFDTDGGSFYLKVVSLDVEFYTETYDRREILINGEEIVAAILKDYSTNKVEFVKHH